eukprot:TRINITY_DN846_c0_g1_i1.p1 TRINITY_DN846_c0_g1~~TRINITY_DN846_c0_g1_i1.p1  ORF type:complete len:415 (-),score=53.38 TRINITY_DN846_c0_g1_i1:157-1401(-)
MTHHGKPNFWKAQPYLTPTEEKEAIQELISLCKFGKRSELSFFKDIWTISSPENPSLIQFLYKGNFPKHSIPRVSYNLILDESQNFEIVCKGPSPIWVWDQNPSEVTWDPSIFKSPCLDIFPDKGSSVTVYMHKGLWYALLDEYGINNDPTTIVRFWNSWNTKKYSFPQNGNISYTFKFSEQEANGSCSIVLVSCFHNRDKIPLPFSEVVRIANTQNWEPLVPLPPIRECFLKSKGALCKMMIQVDLDLQDNSLLFADRGTGMQFLLVSRGKTKSSNLAKWAKETKCCYFTSPPQEVVVMVWEYLGVCGFDAQKLDQMETFLSFYPHVFPTFTEVRAKFTKAFEFLLSLDTSLWSDPKHFFSQISQFPKSVQSILMEFRTAKGETPAEKGKRLFLSLDGKKVRNTCETLLINLN